jgi:alanyl-tRNA synthetase
VLGHKGGIQAGSLVAPDTLRFDFTHFAPLKEDEIQRIEEIANHIILSDLPVEVSFETLEEAKSKGAMALFPEDYQGKEKVRVVSILEGSKPFSVELCGGTHVKHTGEIGLFKIVREEGVAAGVRRVYVATGENLLRHLEERECLLRATSQMLKASDTELISKLEALLHEREALERELRRFKSEWLTSKRDELLQRMERMDDYELVIAQVNLSIEELQELADLLEGSLEQGIVLLGSAQGGKVVLVCKVSDSVTDRLSAGEIVREVAQLVGGKGGGTPRFARGGGPQPERLTEALASIAQKIREELSA